MPGVDLGSAVIAAVEAGLIAKGGGHAMAAGVTIKPGQMSAFRAHITETLGPTVTAARTRSALGIDGALSARGATPEFVHDIERAGPFGAGNPQPTFAFPGHQAKFAEVMGAGGHVRFMLVSGDGARLKAVAFRAASSPLGEALLTAGDRPLHIAGTLSIDHWQGREETQLRLSDVALPPPL
jgi:single-stranded-DNA-specific exonuclease